MKSLFAAAVGAALLAAPAGAQTGDSDMNAAEADRFARLALDCITREYPNKIAHVLNSDEDVAPPRELTPVFYGCYDWHSSVHGHWLLARIISLDSGSPAVAEARAALTGQLTEDKIAAEAEYMAGEGRASFERPYGLAWLLQLTAELRGADDDQLNEWGEMLAPLEQAAVDRYLEWLPNLVYPVRSGTHNQTAFGFALALDWARQTGHSELEEMLVAKSLEFHENDADCPLAYEPSGEDFLSPCLMEADLMRRVLPASDFPGWLSRFLPGIPADGSADWLSVGEVRDPTDGKLVHLDGFNLSRAWNLEAIADALPQDDPRIPALLAAAEVHREAGLAAVSDENYEGGHWLASFAAYLTTKKALEAKRPR